LQPSQDFSDFFSQVAKKLPNRQKITVNVPCRQLTQFVYYGISEKSGKNFGSLAQNLKETMYGENSKVLK